MPVNWRSLLDGPQRLIQRNRKTLLSFALPALILLVGYMTRGIWPVGNRNVLTIDLYHQYAPFMAELQDKLTSGGSLFYSWTGGLGNNFYALFAYYLASPLNILIVLFPPSYLTEAIMLLIVIKIGLAGACFYGFLRGVWKQENLFMVAVSILYALSSYSLAYSWNIMWLDGIFLLPLILLGLVRLVREGRCLLYCVSLGLVIYSNYYIAFFVCIFTGLYFIVTLFEYQSFARPGKLMAAVGRFLAFTALGVGLSAFLSLPTYFSLKLTSAAGDAMPRTLSHFYDLFDYIGQHFILTPPTIRDGMPNLYSGVLLLILVPIYFLAKSVPLKTKFFHLGLIIFLILSFNINTLNFIWHGMHYPNQLPYRNSFVYIFLILSIAYPALMALREFSGKQIGAISAAAVALVLLAQKLNTKRPELQTLYVTIIFIAIYAAVLTIDRIRRMSRNDLALAVLFVVVAELLLNTLLTLHRIDTTEYYSNREGYLDGVQVDQIRAQLAAIEAEEGPFYRVEVIPPRTINDPFMYQYRGVSIFASTMQTKPVKMFENLGFHSNSINSYKYEASTQLLDSLFGIKYLLRRSGNQTYDQMQLISQTDQLTVYRNPYAQSLGFAGPDALKLWRSASGDPFSAQNRLVNAITGGDDTVLVPLKLENGELSNMTFSGSTSNIYNYKKTNKDSEATARVVIKNDEDRQVYLYFEVPANRPDRGFVMIGEKKIDYNAKRSTMIDLGLVASGDEIVFNLIFGGSSPESGRFELYAVALDPAAFKKTMDILASESLQVTELHDTYVRGTIEASQDGILLLTMPYDQGWHAQIDGQPVAITAIDSGLIGLPITAGAHTVELRYTPLWFGVGLIITLLSILILLVIYQIPGPPGRLRRRRQITPPPDPAAAPDGMRAPRVLIGAYPDEWDERIEQTEPIETSETLPGQTELEEAESAPDDRSDRPENDGTGTSVTAGGSSAVV